MPKRKFLQRHRKKAKETKELVTLKAKEYVSGEDQVVTEPPKNVTAKTVEEHRKEVLRGAKRFIYPLSHSKHKIAILSGAIFGAVLLLFMLVSVLLLYRYQSTSEFAYRVAQIIPFPAAKVDGEWVRYEEYLFELRHNIHFHTTQLNTDFDSDEGKRVMIALKNEAMERAKDNATVEQLAQENNIDVSEEEIDAQIDIIRSRGGATQSLETLQNTLAEYYGWDLNDWRRVLRQQLLRQKLTPVLDQQTRKKAEDILSQIQGGGDYAALAAAHSEDENSKGSGGELGVIARSNIELPAAFVEKAFELGEGQTSEIVQTTFENSASGKTVVALHIIKNLQRISDEEIKVAHILFYFRPVNEYIDARQNEGNISEFIKLEELPEPASAESGAPETVPAQ